MLLQILFFSYLPQVEKNKGSRMSEQSFEPGTLIIVIVELLYTWSFESTRPREGNVETVRGD